MIYREPDALGDFIRALVGNNDAEFLVIPPPVVTMHRDDAKRLLQGRLPASHRHFNPILETVRDFAVTYTSVMQCPDGCDPPAFNTPARSPWIVLLGDDLFEALGPSAFHQESLRRVFKAISSAVVVSSGPEPMPYKVAATRAARDRGNVVLIETLPKQQDAWIGLLRSVQPDIGLFLSMPAQERVE